MENNWFAYIRPRSGLCIKRGRVGVVVCKPHSTSHFRMFGLVATCLHANECAKNRRVGNLLCSSNAESKPSDSIIV